MHSSSYSRDLFEATYDTSPPAMQTHRNKSSTRSKSRTRSPSSPQPAKTQDQLPSLFPPCSPLASTSATLFPLEDDEYDGWDSEDVADVCAAFVEELLPSTVEEPDIPPLRTFIAQALWRTRLPPAIAFSGLVLLRRFQRYWPGAAGCATSPHRLFLAAYLLSAKLLQDNSFSNASWQTVSGRLFTLAEIGLMEREMSRYLGWNLVVSRAELDTLVLDFVRPWVARREERVIDQKRQGNVEEDEGEGEEDAVGEEYLDSTEDAAPSTSPPDEFWHRPEPPLHLQPATSHGGSRPTTESEDFSLSPYIGSEPLFPVASEGGYVDALQGVLETETQEYAQIFEQLNGTSLEDYARCFADLKAGPSKGLAEYVGAGGTSDTDSETYAKTFPRCPDLGDEWSANTTSDRRPSEPAAVGTGRFLVPYSAASWSSSYAGSDSSGSLSGDSRTWSTASSDGPAWHPSSSPEAIGPAGAVTDTESRYCRTRETVGRHAAVTLARPGTPEVEKRDRERKVGLGGEGQRRNRWVRLINPGRAQVGGVCE